LLVACTSTPSCVKKRHMAMSPLSTLCENVTYWGAGRMLQSEHRGSTTR
jgi:hypothetical protein